MVKDCSRSSSKPWPRGGSCRYNALRGGSVSLGNSASPHFGKPSCRAENPLHCRNGTGSVQAAMIYPILLFNSCFSFSPVFGLSFLSGTITKADRHSLICSQGKVECWLLALLLLVKHFYPELLWEKVLTLQAPLFVFLWAEGFFPKWALKCFIDL